MVEEGKIIRRAIWRHRGQRFTSGLNMCVSVLLALIVCVMVNYLASRGYLRWDLSCDGFYGLSDKTHAMLNALEADVEIITFVQEGHELADQVELLLQEYVYATKDARHGIRLTLIDPDRDLARARELSRQYQVEEVNVILFACGGRRKFVDMPELVEYEYELIGERAIKKLVAFKGEQIFSSAIQTVAHQAKPVVYFLTGHGERDVNDYSQHAGYSKIARLMRRDNMDVRSLSLAEKGGIPEDASAVILAGPDRRFSRAEVDLLDTYLKRGGRMLVQLDPGVDAGLGTLLESWGVFPGDEVVIGLTLTGRELVVSHYGSHPVTRRLEGVTTMFYMPRALRIADGAVGDDADDVDRPHVQILASCSEKGWAEADLTQTPPRFDEGVDTRGPVPVALAVEKGYVGDIDLEVKPTRLVVIGDSDFASNGALSTGVGGNVDFVLSSLNWLVSREALMAISPKPPLVLRMDMNARQVRLASILIVGVLPGIVALVGFFVWLRRRR